MPTFACWTLPTLPYTAIELGERLCGCSLDRASPLFGRGEAVPEACPASPIRAFAHTRLSPSLCAASRLASTACCARASCCLRREAAMSLRTWASQNRSFDVLEHGEGDLVAGDRLGEPTIVRVDFSDGPQGQGLLAAVTDLLEGSKCFAEATHRLLGSAENKVHHAYVPAGVLCPHLVTEIAEQGEALVEALVCLGPH